MQSITYVTSVGQGSPLMTVSDNGTVLIGEIPNQDNLSSNCKLIVASDVIVTDSESNQRKVLETISEKITFTESEEIEPENLIDNSIWCPIIATIDLSSSSISIEMCSTDGKIATATYKNTVELTKSLMKKYGIDASRVVRHWDVCSKCCPGWNGWGAAGCDASIWNQFKKDIVSGTVATILTPSKTTNSQSSSSSSSSTSASKPTITFKYKVRAGGKWYPEVCNLADYAGVRGKAITDVAIGVTQGSVKYRVHVKGGSWLPYVTGYNTSDGNNGYAGNGREIDAIEVYYNTPSAYANKYGYKKAKYRVAVIGKDYYSWQYDNEKGNGMDGYAGAFGRSMDRFQICPN